MSAKATPGSAGASRPGAASKGRRRSRVIPSAQAVAERLLEKLNAPNAMGWMQLTKILKAASGDLVIQASKPASEFLEVMIELASDSLSARDGDEVFKRLHRVLSNHGGGRPSSEAVWAKWAEEVELLKKRKRSLTAQERYEDVAAAWSSAGNRPVKWRGVRDGISKLKKLRASGKNRV